MLGTTATGVYAACMTLALFANPFTLGIGNSLAPRAAMAFATGGGADLRREVFRITLIVGGAMILFCTAVWFGGETVMRLLYHGQQYEGHRQVVTVLAVAVLASAVGMPASNGLAIIERPNAIFKSGVVAVCVSVVLILCLVSHWGLVGAAYGFLAGNVVASSGRWIAFLAFVPRRTRIA
jgi:O-antigen/teichoic acid export membrane protein